MCELSSLDRNNPKFGLNRPAFAPMSINRKMQALIVDDSKTIRMLFRKFGGGLGFDFTEAENGNEGLDLLEAMIGPELIIVDWKMPVMQGDEFVQIVRSNPLYEKTFILMCTSESGLNEIQSALALGVNDYLPKPCNGRDIHEKLEAIARLIAAGEAS